MSLSCQRAVARLTPGRILGDLADQPPEPANEAQHSLYAGLGPLHVLVRRSDEENREPARVGAVLGDEVVRRLRRALSLRDLRAARRDEAVAEEALERLPVRRQPELVQHLLEIARVDQM